MSISNTLRSINQAEREKTRFEKVLLEQTKKEADITKKINSIKRSITKNSSASVLKTKFTRIKKYEDELVKILGKKAEITNKIAKKRRQLGGLNHKLQKEKQAESKKRQKEQEKIHKDYENRIDVLTSQLKNNISTNLAEVKVKPLEEIYDVFISHASEDKEGFVRELAEILTEDYDIKVWYDELSIQWGDSLRQSIDKGLKMSKFGIVVISKRFIKKGWTNYELDGLFQKEMTYGKTILPIWHDITKDEVQDFSPSLAGKKALNTSMYTVKEIADELKNILKE